MKLYKTEWSNEDEETGETREHREWSGSEAQAKATRTRLMGELSMKRADFHIEAVDVPTTKVELIEWLNKNA